MQDALDAGIQGAYPQESAVRAMLLPERTNENYINEQLKMVEAVGVEPTSETAAALKTTCVSASLLIRRRLLRSRKTSQRLTRLISVLGYE